MASPPGNGACGVGWKERERKSFVAVFRVMRYTESVLLVVLLSLSFIITLWLLGGRPRRDPPRDCLIYSFIPDPTSFETYTLCYFASTFCMGRGTGKAHNKTKEKNTYQKHANWIWEDCLSQDTMFTPPASVRALGFGLVRSVRRSLLKRGFVVFWSKRVWQEERRASLCERASGW